MFWAFVVVDLGVGGAGAQSGVWAKALTRDCARECRGCKGVVMTICVFACVRHKGRALVSSRLHAIVGHHE